jgi:hypothetical protein
MKSPTVPTATGSAASVGRLGGEASRSLGALTGLREPIAGGSDGIGVPSPHLGLADTLLKAYLPKTCTVGRQPEPCAVTSKGSRSRRRNAYGHSVPNQSPIARVGRQDARESCAFMVAARQESHEVVSRGVAFPIGASPGSDLPLSTWRPRRRNADEYPRKAPDRAYRKGESGGAMSYD